MTHLAMMLFDDTPPAGLWRFLSIAAVSLFVIFIPTLHWIDARRKEREAFYRAETLRRITESSGEGAKAAMEMLREEGHQKRITRRERIKAGGVINIAVGLGLIIFLRSLGGADSPYLAGLIPAFIGVAMLIYVYFLAGSIE